MSQDIHSIVIIRADANSKIASGHVMRCSAIAKALVNNGAQVIFAVTDEQSKEFVEKLGYKAEVVGGNFEEFLVSDAENLVQFVIDSSDPDCFRWILVDSYGATDEFLNSLYEFCERKNIKVAVIDDCYTFQHGFSKLPWRRTADLVINYSFGFTKESYKKIYGESSSVQLLIGPKYAPIRNEFLTVRAPACLEICEEEPSSNSSSRNLDSKESFSILVTCGSANPNRNLERIVRGCLDAIFDGHVDIHIVVGSLAMFDIEEFSADEQTHLNIHHDVKDMWNLMAHMDLAISAAGSTLYELAFLGIPTIVIPTTENQIANVRGFSGYRLGDVIDKLDWTSEDVKQHVMGMLANFSLREQYSQKASSLVDGLGAKRIARHIFEASRWN